MAQNRALRSRAMPQARKKKSGSRPVEVVVEVVDVVVAGQQVAADPVEARVAPWPR
jgi:hypothetical protein